MRRVNSLRYGGRYVTRASLLSVAEAVLESLGVNVLIGSTSVTPLSTERGKGLKLISLADHGILTTLY